VTFVTAPASGETVHIKRGNMALTQPTNYTPNDPFPAETHENALDRVALQIQQINEKLGRAIVRSETDSASAQLPINETMKGKTLAFNETTGAVEAGPSIADVDTVSGIAADIATLADIEDGTDATDAIQTVASISGDVTTVSGISSDVTNVSNNAASVSTVAGDSANISTVAGNISDVATVSSNITSVSTVATNIADVITVANDLNEAISEVETVANDLNEAVSEIDTVAGSISNVDTVGTNIANINTVAGISGNVTTVAGISSNVTTVAGVSADVTTVAGISANVTTVAGISSNVSTVAGISSDVTTVAGVSANVTTVATDITNVNTVATNIADVNNFALTYRIAASAPATSLDEGDLYFDTTQNQMFVYTGSAWVAVSPDLVADTTPQLGGNLDLNGSDITGTGNISTTGTATFTGDLTVDTNTLYVDSTNNRVGIGTAAPATALEISTTSPVIRSTHSTSGDYLQLFHNGSGAYIDFSADPLIIRGASFAERLRIDSSGNLLVGKTTAGFANTGHELRGGGSYAAFTRDDATPVVMNRKTSDGDVVEFLKDGGTVGSIGSRGTGTSYIILKSSAGAGAGLTGSDNAILPMDESALADANTDLGGASYRFKDFYLSGSATVGTDIILNNTGYGLIFGNTNGVNIRAASGKSTIFDTAGSERVRIDSGGRVGIGTSSPSSFNQVGGDKLVVGSGSGEQGITLYSGTANNGIIAFADGTTTTEQYRGYIQYNHPNDSLQIATASTEAMRIDSSGNVLVGKTANSIGGSGVVIRGGGELFSTRAGDVAGFNRLTTDGPIVQFYKDSSVVGSIGTEGADLWVGNDNCGLQFVNNSAGSRTVRPFDPSTNLKSDNTVDLGQSTARFDDIYATNGTIQTSDQNEKQQIASLTDAEIVAAKAISQLFKTFKWNDKVAAKGDAARRHTGVVAQDVEAAMTAAGLDAGDYAFFISTTWWEADGETYYNADDAPEGATEHNRKGIRYPELLSFVGAATEQRLANIETRLAALEAN